MTSLDYFNKIIKGDFTLQQLKTHIFGVSTIFWLLILISSLFYPNYSIMHHSFSYIGRPDVDHNPRAWWLFSVAMIFWGIALIPFTIYSYRKFKPVSKTYSFLGAFFLILFIIGLVLIAIFPDGKEYGGLHAKVSLLGFGGLLFATF